MSPAGKKYGKGAKYIPRRRDIVWLSFSPTRGHEQGGHRPAVVVSGDTYNQNSGLALVCPITSKVKGYPFEVPLTMKGKKAAVLVDQVRCVDWRTRGIRFEQKMSPKRFSSIIRYLVLIFAENGEI